ncbi:hypothetical protein CANARDRAFT_27747 [[Candida] arabinofermentans NRRL YB-2248]|uniref:BCD1 alpha/beta domain-containing protein n=1 Tax=[Candida] arabinofermentans NRRL YB-2248 TaxID=983967 RepID=A0A1E4T460_9ASCO|nr:hypothetical protein CANARDRAFT_27747 [[Candida] arabinofermentans NRRL YB-2248]
MNKTKYIKKGKIDGTDVQRDYNLLNKINRKIELGVNDIKSNKIISSKRNNNDRGRNSNGNPNKRRHFEDETNFVIKRGAKLKQLPMGMSRKLQNKSAFDAKKGKFFWTLEWLLVDSRVIVMNQFTSYKNAEDLTLQDIVPFKRFSKTLEEKGLVDMDSLKLDAEHITKVDDNYDVPLEMRIRALPEGETSIGAISIPSQEELAARGRLGPFPSGDHQHHRTVLREALSNVKSQLTYFVKSHKHKNTMVRMEADTKLSDVVRNRTFIEFPTIYVSLSYEFIGKDTVLAGKEEDELDNKKEVEDAVSDIEPTSESESESESSSSDSSDDGDSDDESSGPEEESAKKPI